MAGQMKHDGSNKSHAKPLVHGFDLAFVKTVKHHHTGYADDESEGGGQRSRIFF